MNNLLLGTMVLMAALGSDQTRYDYPSHTATYAAGMTYVICSECPGPTPKQLMPVKQPARMEDQIKTAQAMQPLRIDPSIILPAPKAKLPQTIRETLYFEYNSSRPPQWDKQKLAEIKKAALEPGAKVTITGFTDKRGNKRYNNRLALLRAKAVRQYLGLDKEAIVVGKGKCCYLDESHEGKNRRVEVVIEMESPKVQKVADVKPQLTKQNDAPAKTTVINERAKNIVPAESPKVVPSRFPESPKAVPTRPPRSPRVVPVPVKAPI